MQDFDFKQLLKFFEKYKKGLTFQELASLSGVKYAAKGYFGRWITQLTSEGALYQCPHSKTYLPTKKTNYFEGYIKVNERNFGFVTSAEPIQEVFVLGRHFNGALDKDFVGVRTYEVLFESNKTFGIVEKVIERFRKTLVGRVIFSQFHNRYLFEPLDLHLRGVFYLENFLEETKNKVVEAKILDYAKGVFNLEIIKVYGDIQEKGVDIAALLGHHNVRVDFDEETLEEANKVGEITSEDLKGRRDLREKLIFTIDGANTKDFDDAISIEKGEMPNTYKLGVHIADVAYYVREGSKIEQEAKERATSIYFLDSVIPMIPSRLSDGLCSLVPNQDRLTLSMEALIDGEGNNLSVEFFPSIIRSTYRLTYSQVNAFFENRRGATKELSEDLHLARELSNILRAKKIKEGFCDLELSEEEFLLNPNGEIRSIKEKTRGISEMMIEDFMVRANENLASFLEAKKLPSIFRVHSTPSLEKFEYLQNLADFLELSTPLSYPLKTLDFAKVVEEIRSKDKLSEFAKTSLLRSLERATYSHQNTQHFGLASKAYLHFSSPLRRFPDLFVHQILHTQVFKTFKSPLPLESLEAKAQAIAQHTTLREREASRVEQDIIYWKQLKFFAAQKAKKFQVEIISVEKNGLFCETSSKISGFLPFKAFEGEIFETTTFRAKSERHEFWGGQKLWVKIEEINTQSFNSRIIFQLIE